MSWEFPCGKLNLLFVTDAFIAKHLDSGYMFQWFFSTIVSSIQVND